MCSYELRRSVIRFRRSEGGRLAQRVNTRPQADARVVHRLVGAEKDGAADRYVQHTRAQTGEQSARRNESNRNLNFSVK